MRPTLVYCITPFVLFLSTLVSCGKDKNVENNDQQVTHSHDGTVYKLDPENSIIEWKGFKVVKSDQTSHFGTLKFSEGEAWAKNGQLQGGTFIVDMTTVLNVDLSDDEIQKGKLENHLKSSDFFDVEKFPIAKFEITKVEKAPDAGDYNTKILGNLTIKGVSKPVQFNANVSVHKDQVSIATEPTDINREDFGVSFQMPLENGIVKNEINIQILIKAAVAK